MDSQFLRQQRQERSLPTRGRWKFLRHALVRPLLQLPAEAFVGLLFWTLMVEFFHCIWWFQLREMAPTWHLVFLVYLFVPACVLGQSFLRNYLDEHPWSRALLVLAGLVAVGGQMDPRPIYRLSFSGSGVAVMGTFVAEGVWAGTTARRRKAGFGLTGGLVLLQTLQWAYCGRNPLVARWWGLLFLGLLPGSAVALLVLYEDLAEWEGEELGAPAGMSGALENGGEEAEEEVELLQNDPMEVLSDDWDNVEMLELADAPEAAEGSWGGAGGRRTSEDRWLQARRIKEGLGLASSPLAGEGGAMGARGGPLGPAEGYRENDKGGLQRDDASPVAGGPELADAAGGARAAERSLSSVVRGGNLRQGLSMARESERGLRRFEEGEEVPWQEEGYAEARAEEGGGYDSEMDIPYINRDTRWRFRRSGAVRSVQMAIGYGSLLFLTHWLLTAPTLAPRWLGLSAWWGLLPITALTAGTALAAEVTRNSLPKRIQGVLAWLVAMCGAALLSESSSQIGGALLALAAPSLWVVLSRNTFGVYTGLGLGLGAALYILLVLWSVGLVAFQELPGGRATRNSDRVLMGTAILGVGIGLVRGPEVTAEERREFGARLGAWRLGRLTWGSGVPDRQAVGALAAVVAVVVLCAAAARAAYSAGGPLLPLLPAGAGGRDASGGEHMRVLSFNVYQGFNRAGGINFDAIRAVLAEQRPHVALLQETDLMRIMHGNQDMVDFLATWLPMYSLYTPPTRANTWGCAILSALPIVFSEWEVLPSPNGENACFQHIAVSLGGRAVHVMNAHFGDVERDVELQAERVKARVGEVMRPGKESLLVLAGDFNTRPLSPAYETLVSTGLVDAHAAKLGPWQSAYSRDPGAGYVFLSANLNVTVYLEPQYPQEETADGFPLVVTFKL